MSSNDAPAIVREPLIQVIGETVDEQSTPELFTPVTVAPPGKFQSDGWFGSPPGAARCAVEFTKFWAPLASDFMYHVERARESCSYSQGAFHLFFGR